jgi:tetratricopeptide (TPR) repeat protein
MPIKVISGVDAFANLKRNAQARWPDRKSSDNRLEPICNPAFSSDFRIARGDSVFTMGSCFARNIESGLAQRGFDVVTHRPDARKLLTEIGGDSLAVFGVASLYNELNWAFGDGSTFDEAANFFEMAPGKFIDIHLPRSLRPASIEVLRERRAGIRAINRQVAECKLVVLTLGLAEVWFDRATGQYLNTTPQKTIVAKFPGRFELHVLDYDTTHRFLRDAIRLVREHGRPDQRIILTVSPIPLVVTFTEQDVLIANCYSKSVLRTAVEQVVSSNDNIGYFPSYESVTLSDRHLAWSDDLRHPLPTMIHANVSRLIKALVEENDDRDVNEAVESAKEYLDAQNLRVAIGYLEPIADRLDQPEHRSLYAEICARLGRREEAIRILEELPEDVGGWRRRLFEGQLRLHLGDAETAQAIAVELTASSPRSSKGWYLMAAACSAQKKWDDATLAAKRMAEVTPKTGAAFEILAEIYHRQGKLEAARSAYAMAIEREPGSQKFLFSYADFLIQNKCFDEARDVMRVIAPENRAQSERLSTLQVFAN